MWKQQQEGWICCCSEVCRVFWTINHARRLPLKPRRKIKRYENVHDLWVFQVNRRWNSKCIFEKPTQCWGQLVLNSRETEREWRLINISSLLPSAVNRRCGRPLMRACTRINTQHYRIIECLFGFIWFLFKDRECWRSLDTLNCCVTEK